jgi:hypothetical protein
MRALLKILGLGLLIWGIYFLGSNIFFTTGRGFYGWRGIAANLSVLSLVAGVLMLVFLPRDAKNLGWVPVIVAIVLVFVSGRVILNPTSLWQFFLSFALMVGGYKLLMTGRSPF